MQLKQGPRGASFLHLTSASYIFTVYIIYLYLIDSMTSFFIGEAGQVTIMSFFLNTQQSAVGNKLISTYYIFVNKLVLKVHVFAFYNVICFLDRPWSMVHSSFLFKRDSMRSSIFPSKMLRTLVVSNPLLISFFF